MHLNIIRTSDPVNVSPTGRVRVFHRWLKRRQTQKLQRGCAHCYLKEDQMGGIGAELCENCKLRDWLSNYRLNDVNSFSLFNEFLEMGILQYIYIYIYILYIGTHTHTLLHTTLHIHPPQ